MINCLDCGYYLDGLERDEEPAREYRCPECGRRFDPENPDSYGVDEPGGRPVRCGYFLLFLSLLGVAVVSYPLLPFPLPQIEFLPLLTYGILVQLANLVLGILPNFFQQYRNGACYRIAMMITGVVLLTEFGIAFWAVFFALPTRR